MKSALLSPDWASSIWAPIEVAERRYCLPSIQPAPSFRSWRASFILYTSSFCKFCLGNNRGTQAGERERVVDDEAHDEGPEHGRTVGFHEPLRRSGNFVQNADEKSDGPGDVPGPVDAQPRPRPFLPRQDVIGGHGAANRAEGRADDLE